MNTELITDFEDASPNPEYLIKSIAEQGYSLETSLADLMDNSVSARADKIEVLIKTDEEPFTLFVADNGRGMNESELKASMLFPSNSPEHNRQASDLGRFGLGMKTASFAQTRRFTVLSKTKGNTGFAARTWDVAYLKEVGQWRLIINGKAEIEALLAEYTRLSEGHLNKFDEFEANTIVIWQGLYKFENYLEDENRQAALKKQVTEVTSDYLSLVFHRFMERKERPLHIRINNNLISPFNPFPVGQRDFRPMEYKQRNFHTDTIKIEGFILPSRSMTESRERNSIWTTKNRSLMDMEGIYVYRADRIILFGGWNDLIKKAPRLQLARLRVEVGNSVDHLLHLNVAKSQVVIPHDLVNAFENYIDELKTEAEREYFNRGIKKFGGKKKENTAQLFERMASNRGILLEMNHDFALTRALRATLDSNQTTLLNLIMKMVNTHINEIRQAHQHVDFTGVPEKDGITHAELEQCILRLKKSGLSSEIIRNDILPDLGFNEATIPETVLNLLK